MSPPSLKHLYLASQSPRRLELLRQVGLEPTVLPLRTASGRYQPPDPLLAFLESL